jgi:uncharacterized membrane protein HdeD (DUF308 family)
MGAYSEQPEEPWSVQRWRQPPAPPPGPTELPVSLRKAVDLMYAGAVLTVVGILLRFLAGGPERDRARERNPGISPDEAATIQLLGAVIGGAIVVGLWCWMASSNRQGKGWARTTATVFGVLAILSGAFSLAMSAATGSVDVVDIGLTVVETGLAAVILVLLHQDESSRYYAGHDRRRW